MRDLFVADHRIRDRDLPARLGLRIEQVALGTDRRRHRRDQLLADGVERRVGDLREQLLEVVVEQPRTVREHRQRRVGAHRADRFLALLRHRREQNPQILVRVAERLLAPQHRRVIRQRELRARPEGRRCPSRCAFTHSPYGLRARELALQLLVVDDAALRRVDEEDLARVQALLDGDVLRGEVEHAQCNPANGLDFTFLVNRPCNSNRLFNWNTARFRTTEAALVLY